jgi:predicted phage terminase large subunit-like protein
MINITPEKAGFLLDEGSRQKLSIFTQRAFATVDPGTEYLHNWHIDCISEYLTACTNRDIKRLIINIPPRSLKSISVTVAWPAWLLGLNPSERILAASYSQKLSLKHSQDTRHIIQAPWYNNVFPDVQLSGTENQKARFETTERGHRIATSVGGSATGEGGNILIVDDPHNPLQASSDVQRVTALDWFDQTFSSRLNNKKRGVIVVVMQRLHQADLTGHLLEKGGWEHLCLPATAEKKQFIHMGSFEKTREVGDLLHENREGPEELETIKRDLGSYGYAGQYQQRPAPLGGGMFKDEWWMYYDILPEMRRSFVVGDTAMKAKEQHDYSVFMHWGEGVNGNAYLIDMQRGKWEAPELEQAFVAFYNKCKHNSLTKLQKALIEDKASGTGLIQSIKRKYKIPISGIQRNREDKVQRAMGVIPFIESGYVFLPRSAHFLSDLLNECRLFPNGENDDQIDTISDGLDEILNKKKDFRARVI